MMNPKTIRFTPFSRLSLLLLLLIVALVAAGCQNALLIPSAPSAVGEDAATPAAPPAAETPAAEAPVVAPETTGASAPAPTDDGLVQVVRQIFLESLGYDPALQPADQAGISDVTVFELTVPDGWPRAWAAHTVGLRDFLTEQSHILAIYQLAGADSVAEAARIQMEAMPAGAPDSIGPDYVDAQGVTQLAIEPSSIWLGVDGGVGAHSGAFVLYRFAAGELTSAIAAFNSSPGVGSTADLNADGLLEVVIDATEPYVFCYACGVRIPQFNVWRWDGTQMAEVRLQQLPADASSGVVALNTELLTYVQAGLWGKVRETLDALDAAQVADAALPEELSWNMALARLNEEAKRARLAPEASPYPLLEYVFYGDYGSAVNLFRPYSAADIFVQGSPLVAGTVAEGWEETLAGWVLRSTDAALTVEPAPAELTFLRAWAAWLLGDNATALTELESAVALAPDDSLYTDSLETLRGGNAPAGAFAAPANLALFSGPGEEWPPVASPEAGTLLTATGRPARGDWIQVQIAPADPAETPPVAWMISDPALVSASAVEALPKVAAPPLFAPIVTRGRIFFSAIDARGISAIWSVEVVTGAEPLLIIEEARQPALQPQGQRLAFTSTRVDMLGLGGLDLRTSERLRFTLNVEDHLPRWFSDGNLLAFSSTREGDRRPRIYSVWSDDISSSAAILMGHDADPRAGDGLVVFKGCDDTGSGCGLWTAAPDGSDRSPLTANPNDARPRWSPDGSRVVFMSDGRDGDWELYLLSSADLSVGRLTTSPGPDGLPTFSPDGNSVAWIAQRNGVWQLLTVALDPNGAPTTEPQISVTLGDDLPDWLDHGLDWAP